MRVKILTFFPPEYYARIFPIYGCKFAVSRLYAEEQIMKVASAFLRFLNYCQHLLPAINFRILVHNFETIIDLLTSLAELHIFGGDFF